MGDFSKPSINWQAADLDREWRRFRQHCDFTFNGPLSKKSEKEKANYVMTFIGDKGREIYNTFQWREATETEAAEFETLQGVYDKYSSYVAPKKNEIKATVNFHRRKQEIGERFDQFVTGLKLLVRDCGYTEPDRMVRDAIVIGACNSAVRERCLEKGTDLTLDMAVNIGQSYETSQDSLKLISVDEDTSVNAVLGASGTNTQRHNRHAKVKQNRNKHRHTDNRRHNGNHRQRQSVPLCGQCGYDRSHKKCPALGNRCNFCNGMDHFVKVCRKKDRSRSNVQVITSDVSSESSSDEELTHLINTVTDTNKTEWTEQITVGQHKLQVQIDTGAAQSLIPYKLFKTLNNKQPVLPSDKKFQSYTRHPIIVEGRVTLPTQYKDECVDIQYYIVHVNQQPLLSGQASCDLGLIERVHNVIDEIDRYPELRKTTATLPGTYSLKIDPTVTPVVHGPRRQPKALAGKIIAKLKEMESAGQITKVVEPTDWVSSMVAVVKKDKVRICIDPKDLNKGIRREHYPIPTVEEIISSFPNAKVLSVLDAKSGFLQIKLDYESSLLTTFNSPIGRYRWLRLPFGIKSSPELFQRIMDNMLEGINGARALIDDILIAGVDDEDHDRIIQEVVNRTTANNLSINFEKRQVKLPSVKYAGHIISKDGLHPDPDKVRALCEMPAPKSKEDIRRFLGMIQYLGKFIPNLSDIDAPLRDVIKKDVLFYWNKPQQVSFDKLKELCSSAPVLATYDNNKEVTIQCDASSYAVGGVLLQDGRPVAYTSRALNDTEQRYAQIEKETLAIVHSCKKFHYYIFGKPVTVQSDHKPLQAIFSKAIQCAPMRLQTMMLRLQPYDLTVTYKPGKDIPIGDALSRANLPDSEPDIPIVLVNMVDYVAVTKERYNQFQKCTANELNELHSIILKGWPDTKQETPHSIRQYWNIRDELSVLDGIVYKGLRIVVPPSMRADMLSQIHESHMGITKCRLRARESLYWPGMSQQVENLISDCALCSTYQNKQPKQPLKPTKVPDFPWCEIASDIFHWEGDNYIVTVDYFSKFIEVDKLTDLSSTATVDAVKTQVCRHGIPEVIRTDNGPQYASKEFRDFCHSYGIQHVTSSPNFAQSNGESERAVQIIKRLWRKCTDKQLSLLDYRTTQLESCGLSPAQLSMGRRPRNKLPTCKELLYPTSYDLSEVKRRLNNDKQKQQEYYNRHASKDPTILLPGDPVRMSPLPGTKEWLPATVLHHHNTPPSYVVERDGKKYRRNRKYLRLSTYKAHVNQPLTQQRFEPATSQSPTTKPATSPSRPPIGLQQPTDRNSTSQLSPLKSKPATAEKHSSPTPIVTRSGRVIVWTFDF